MLLPLGVPFWKLAANEVALTLDSRPVDEHEESDDEKEQRPVRGDCEAGRNQEAPEIERVSGVRVWARCGQLVILDDVSRCPAPDEQPDERHCAAEHQ